MSHEVRGNLVVLAKPREQWELDLIAREREYERQERLAKTARDDWFHFRRGFLWALFTIGPMWLLAFYFICKS